MFRVLGYMIHTPVLLKEVIRYLNPRPNENFIDATFGGGGHALEILKRIAPKGKLLGLDWDPTSLGLSAKLRRASSAEGFKLETRSENLAESEPLIRSGIELGPFSKTRNDADGTRNYPSTSLGAGADDSGLIVECANFAEIENISREYFPEGVNGVLFDFGLRTGQLEGDEKGEKGKMNRRGFSYLKNEPLDMRFNMDQPLTASEIINTWPERELEIIFKDYGEEKNARKIAKAIVEARKQSKIETTGELVEIIGGRDIKTLARIFQALRIAVNNELENIRLGLEGAWRMLKPGGLASPSPSQGGPASPSPSQGGPASPSPSQGGPASPSQGGRLAAISFHSLEDRIVKNFFKERKISGGAGDPAPEQARCGARILTPKPVTPSKEEVGSNSRSRSAKLRAIRKMTND